MSFGGEEEFYTPVVAGIVWVGDAKLGRQLVLLMALAFYVAGFLKNCLCLPRPPSPPITPLLRCTDWALPSHHAVLNVNIPWYIWFYTSLNYPLTPAAYVPVFACVSVWSFCIMFSRMYLGVHSPADILTGGIIGCLLLALWLQLDEVVDAYIASGGEAALLFVLVVGFLLWLHPDPHPTTLIFVETVSMVSVMVGVAIARSHAPPYVLYAAIERSHTYASALHLVACCVCRFALGFTMVLAAKATVAMVTRYLLHWVCQLGGVPTVFEKRVSMVTSERVHYSTSFVVTEEVRADSSYHRRSSCLLPQPASQDPDKSSWQWQPFNLYLPVKVLSYVSIGLVTVEIAPYMFHVVGI